MKKDPVERIATALEAIVGHYAKQDKREIAELKKTEKLEAEDRALRKKGFDEAMKAQDGLTAFQAGYTKQMQQLLEQSQSGEEQRKLDNERTHARLDVQEERLRELSGLPPKKAPATLHSLKPEPKQR